MESPASVQVALPGALPYEEAWERVVGQLRIELSRSQFDTWVEPLRPVSYREGVFTLSAGNAYGREWVENRLKSRITRLLEGVMAAPVSLNVTVEAPPAPIAEPPTERSSQAGAPLTSNRKLMLQRAYGSERARIIQPERGMFVTLYFFYEWVPLIGHSAAAAILAARSLCYWNPLTGELRNTVETDMADLARRASVSVRTMKDVLNNELVQRYFLRYRVRRVMTPNGVRTAGILLQVRMDDPLTPADQEKTGMSREDEWVPADFLSDDFEQED